MIDIILFFKTFTFEKHFYLVIIPFLLWFLMGKWEKNFRIVACLGVGVLILVTVKGILRIPHPKYTHTFSIPSGHTYMTMLLWGGVIFEIFKDRFIQYMLLFLIGCLEAWRVVYFGFHEPIDAIVAIALCIFQFILYYEFLVKKIPVHKILFFCFYSQYISIFFVSKLASVFMEKSSVLMNLVALLNLLFFLIYEGRSYFRKYNKLSR